MLESSLTAIKWIADKLIEKLRSDKRIKREKWMQVAHYFDAVAESIDSALIDFRNQRPAYRSYGQITRMLEGLRPVLEQIYNSRKPAESQRMIEFGQAMVKALHIMSNLDLLPEEVMEDAAWYNPESTFRKQLMYDLEAAAGEFRGISEIIRAQA